MRGLVFGVLTLIIVGIGVTLYQGNFLKGNKGLSDPTPTVVQKTMDASNNENIKQYEGYPDMVIDPSQSYTVTLTTNKGDIVIETFPEEVPKTVNNFIFYFVK